MTTSAASARRFACSAKQVEPKGQRSAPGHSSAGIDTRDQARGSASKPRWSRSPDSVDVAHVAIRRSWSATPAGASSPRSRLGAPGAPRSREALAAQVVLAPLEDRGVELEARGAQRRAPPCRSAGPGGPWSPSRRRCAASRGPPARGTRATCRCPCPPRRRGGGARRWRRRRRRPSRAAPRGAPRRGSDDGHAVEGGVHGVVRRLARRSSRTSRAGRLVERPRRASSSGSKERTVARVPARARRS